LQQEYETLRLFRDRSKSQEAYKELDVREAQQLVPKQNQETDTSGERVGLSEVNLQECLHCRIPNAIEPESHELDECELPAFVQERIESYTDIDCERLLRMEKRKRGRIKFESVLPPDKIEKSSRVVHEGSLSAVVPKENIEYEFMRAVGLDYMKMIGIEIKLYLLEKEQTGIHKYVDVNPKLVQDKKLDEWRLRQGNEDEFWDKPNITILGPHQNLFTKTEPIQATITSSFTFKFKLKLSSTELSAVVSVSHVTTTSGPDRHVRVCNECFKVMVFDPGIRKMVFAVV